MPPEPTSPEPVDDFVLVRRPGASPDATYVVMDGDDRIRIVGDVFHRVERRCADRLRCLTKNERADGEPIFDIVEEHEFERLVADQQERSRRAAEEQARVAAETSAALVVRDARRNDAPFENVAQRHHERGQR